MEISILWHKVRTRIYEPMYLGYPSEDSGVHDKDTLFIDEHGVQINLINFRIINCQFRHTLHDFYQLLYVFRALAPDTGKQGISR